MCKVQKLGYLILLLCGGFKVTAQEMSLSKLQDQVEATIAKTRGASVLITDYDPIKKLAYGGRFSGVVVDEAGVILTVAHATTPSQSYQVTFPDGKKYTATGLGRVSSIGLAMLKINEKGDWPVAEMGSSSTLKNNEPCLSIAYPASFDQMIPVVRFGYVAEVQSSVQANRIRTSCLMEPGDSGGPVFDLSGRVIGMNNNVDMSLEGNYEVPIDLYRKYWNALLEPEDYKDSPIGEALYADTLRKVAAIFSDITRYGAGMAETEKKFSGGLARIGSVVNEKKCQALGTMLNVKGSTYVLSKSSIVGERAFLEMPDGTIIETSVSFRDEAKDLVLLKVIGASIQGLAYTDLVKGEVEHLKLGKFLCSPLPNGQASWSVVGSERFDLEAKFRAGYTAAITVIKDGKLVVDAVQQGTEAGDAGLKVGDEIVSIAGVPVKSPDNYLSEIRKKRPGQVVLFNIRRMGKPEAVAVKLDVFPVVTPNHPASFFTGGRSLIRDGFDHVYIHDGRLTPSECGGPIFDLDGRFVGMNMARYSRVSNVLLPVSELMDFLRTGLNLAHSGS